MARAIFGSSSLGLFILKGPTGQGEAEERSESGRLPSIPQRGAWIILGIIFNICLATYVHMHAISKKDQTKDTYIWAVQCAAGPT